MTKLKEMAKDWADDEGWTLENYGDYQHEAAVSGYEAGFQKALEIAAVKARYIGIPIDLIILVIKEEYENC